MPNFTESALRLLKPLFGNRLRVKGSDTGSSAVLDGNSAIALTEAMVSQAAGLCASTTTDIAALVWRTEQQRRDNSQNREHRLATVSTEGARGALAAATGLSMSGVRAAAFISGQESASLQDLLSSISGRHLPLVVHIDNRAIGGSSNVTGSGHEACHLSADSGCFLLCASNVQEAVDFTLVARRVAEQTLRPGLVFMDREQTASAPQQVQLPSAKLLEDFLGQPEDKVACITQAEKLLFGDERRRIPCWHDPDRPIMLGGVQPNGIWGLSRASSRLYFAEALEKTIEHSFNLLAERSGRQYASMTAQKVTDADLLLVVMGSAIETAEAVADLLRSTKQMKVGVIGIRSLRPFPSERIKELLGKSQTVCVLERLDSSVTTDPPLLRELTAAVNRTQGVTGQGNAQAGSGPRLLSVLYGMGGLPLCASDLIELCLQAEKIQKRQLYLGISFDQTSDPHPKRQVLLDRLRRSYPNLSDMGLTGSRSDEPDLSPEDAVTVALHRISGSDGEGVAQEAANFLWQVAGGELRSRIAQSPLPWGGACTDWFAWAPTGLRDPGDRLSVDLAIITTTAIESAASNLKLNQRAALLFDSTAPQNIRLPAATIAQIKQCDGQLYQIDSREAGDDADLRNERLLGAAFGILLERELLETGFRRLLSSRETELSELPADIREARLSAFKGGFDQIKSVDIESLTAMSMEAKANADQVSQQLRRLGNIDDNYDNLPRFWDQTGVLYRERTTDRIIADPYLAIGAIPPFSSAFRKFDNLRAAQPVFDAAACTGCGACWTLCPDGAIGVSVMDPAMLLETCVRITGTDRLRPMLSKLSISMIKRCREKGVAPATAGELLNETFDWLLQQSLPENRKQLVAGAKNELIEALGALQISLTEPLFREPESDTPGSGNILFLAINPDTCKGCGICVSSCEPNALTLEKQTTKLAAEAGRNWKIWEQLPDTSEETIARAGSQIPTGKPAATLMSQRFRGTLCGGDGAEPGSGERLALRLALAAVESRQRPLTNVFVGEVDAIRERLSTLIKKILADALPADDLDTLAAGLESVDTSETDLTQFINETEGEIDTRIDALRMRRLIALAQKLRDLSWRLSEGRQGFGRASLGIVLSSDTATGWAGVFPDNPFAVPVSVDTTGDAAQFAAGLQQGQLQRALEGFVLMRKARLELENPADAARLWSSLENLGWDDLEAEERALCSPVLIVGSSAMIAGRGLSQLAGIMAGKLPVKLMLFPELDLGVAAGGNSEMPLAPMEDPGIDLALLTLSRRNTLNAQCSVGFPDHLMATLEAALDFPGPALIQIYAPSPARHGFPADQTVQQARLAVETRTFPLFRYDPVAEGVFGSRFNLEANPDSTSDWLSNDSGASLTTATWTLGQRRFAQWLSPLPADAPDAIPLEEYIALPQETRSGKMPFITDGDTTRYQVKAPLAKICETHLHSWRTLQEIAGLVTPFTKRIEQQAEQSVAASHQAELQKMQAAYESRIGDLKQEMLEQSRTEIRMRLMAMAGYDESGSEETTRAPH